MHGQGLSLGAFISLFVKLGYYLLLSCLRMTFLKVKITILVIWNYKTFSFLKNTCGMDWLPQLHH